MVSLLLGVTIGILSTIVTNQREIDHLNELLEQAENMVKDLHNKLEIKVGFNTTNEHATEPNATANYSPKAQNFEVTSDIEAELEAELERLEENMQRLSSVVEVCYQSQEIAVLNHFCMRVDLGNILFLTGQICNVVQKSISNT